MVPFVLCFIYHVMSSMLCQLWNNQGQVASNEMDQRVVLFAVWIEFFKAGVWLVSLKFWIPFHIFMKINWALELVYIVQQCQSMTFAPTRFENSGSRVLMVYSLIFIQVFKKFQMNLCCLLLPLSQA